MLPHRKQWFLALALSLTTVSLAACQSTAESVERATDPRDLGPADFIPDGGAVEDVVEEADIVENSDDPEGQRCNILDDDCGASRKCTPGLNGLGLCQTAGELGVNDSCGQLGFDDCGAGLLCVQPDLDSGFACLSICDAGGGTPSCPDGGDCSPSLEWVVENVGVCL